MEKQNNIIQFNLDAMALVKQDGDKFLIDPKAEDALNKWIEFKSAIEKVDEEIKKRLQEQMTVLNTVKIEGDKVKVIRRFYGERYELIDPVLAKELGFAITETKIKTDTKAVERYIQDTGDLPDGVKLRDRKETVTISEIK